MQGLYGRLLEIGLTLDTALPVLKDIMQQFLEWS